MWELLLHQDCFSRSLFKKAARAPVPTWLNKILPFPCLLGCLPRGWADSIWSNLTVGGNQYKDRRSEPTRLLGVNIQIPLRMNRVSVREFRLQLLKRLQNEFR